MARHIHRVLVGAVVALAVFGGVLWRSALTTTFAAAGATVGERATPQTLVTVRGRIGAFAQDGDRIAWLWPTASCLNFVQLRNVRTGRQVRLAAPRGATCPPLHASVDGALALGGERALWAVYDTSTGMSIVFFRVSVIAGGAGTRDRVVGSYEYTEDRNDSGDVPLPTVPMAGDGATLVYVGLRGVRRVLAGRSVRIGKLTRPGAFAVTAGRIAVAQSSFGGCVCNHEPAWSPDGGRLVFEGAPDDVDSLRVYVVSAAGGTPTLLVDGQGPQWSPDGTKIAFARGSFEKGFDLVAVDADGRNPRVLIRGVFEWSWSPDGSRLAFSREDGIGVVNADGTDARLVASGGGSPQWSPDGMKLAFTAIGQTPTVEVANVDGSDRHAVTTGSAAKWSPDGGRLLFERNGGIYVISRNGTGETQLTHPELPLVDWASSWSPDGKRIVFDRGLSSGVEARIWLMNQDGSSQRRLTGGVGDEADPAWSPDGTKIAFVRGDGSYGGGELYVVGGAGAGETRQTTTHPLGPRSAGGVYAVGSGRQLRAFAANGTVRALAVSQSALALLVQGSFGQRIELFDPRTGAARGGVAVDRRVESELSAAGRRIVFRANRQIMLLDAVTMRVSRLAIAAARPIGLSIEGRRVAWAENLSGQARVRALTAP